MLIMKFGGSSLADAERIHSVVTIITDKLPSEEAFPIIVVSAMKGVTNLLLVAASSAEKGDLRYKDILKELRIKHHDTALALVTDLSLQTTLLTKMELCFKELEDILHGIELVHECSLRSIDLISGFGERLSSYLVAAHCVDRGFASEAKDARDFIRTDNSHGQAVVDFKETNALVQKHCSQNTLIPVVTGFVASTSEGVATTLGRNGSDYTASILGAALNVSAVEIWTDVDGILTADPRIVPNASVIDEISFYEAMELSYFGAEVIHPSTLSPLVEKNIPIYIKNTLNPRMPGTRIAKKSTTKNFPITGIASVDNVSMITVEGGGMIGMLGLASRIFTSVAAAKVNVMMISQASSENSLCFVCQEIEAQRAAEILHKDLADMLDSRRIRKIDTINDLEIIAVVGENMRGQIGLSGKLFDALGKADINILAIAQGSTELNISFVVKKIYKVAAIRTIHQTFIQ